MTQTQEKYLISWLLQNIDTDSDENITMEDLKDHYREEVSGVTIAKLLKTLFPYSTSKRVRLAGNWVKKTQVFSGIKWSEYKSDLNLGLKDVSDLALKSGFFLVSLNDVSLKLGYFNGDTINGNKVLFEITFKNIGIWEIMVLGKTINLTKSQVSNNFEFSEKSVHGVFQVVKHLQLCSGVIILNENMHSLKDLMSKPGVIKEQRYQEGDENSYFTTLRIDSCLVVRNLTSISTSCSKCKAYLKPAEVTDTNKLMPDEGPPEKVLKYKNLPELNTCTTDTNLPTINANLTLTKGDNDDLLTILQNVIPDCAPNMATFLLAQKQSLERQNMGRRWDKQIIRLCLTLYCRSPRGYEDLKNSGFIVLPSQRLLQYYKNSCQQIPGVNKEVLHWMLAEAKNRNLPIEGYSGGLSLDEMSIESDLQFRKKGNQMELVGFCDITDESTYMEKLTGKTSEVKLATHVLQLVFLGFTGFRFPFAHFPTIQANASELYLIFWKTIKTLSMFGFTVSYVSMDGAQTNRDFMKMFFESFNSNAILSMKVNNVFSPLNPPIVLIMDFSHVLKKIRNNVLKSGHKKGHTRCLTVHGQYILWKHWFDAYQWDLLSNPFPIYQQLTNEHFLLTSETKMRNKFAEDTMNEEMLHLMKCYKESLGEDGPQLDASIDFLKQTSVLVKTFRDSRPICTTNDNRLSEIITVLQWFRAWESSISCEKSSKIKSSLMSYQTREDIASLIIGFQELCHIQLEKSHASIIPSRINSDVIENVFCQQRGLYNGASTNPPYISYCRTMNSIILGQSSVSRKSNAGRKGAEPFNISTKQALRL